MFKVVVSIDQSAFENTILLIFKVSQAELNKVKVSVFVVPVIAVSRFKHKSDNSIKGCPFTVKVIGKTTGEFMVSFE